MPDPIRVRPEDVEALRGFIEEALSFLDGGELHSVDSAPRKLPGTNQERDQLAAASRLLTDLGGPPE